MSNLSLNLKLIHCECWTVHADVYIKGVPDSNTIKKYRIQRYIDSRGEYFYEVIGPDVCETAKTIDDAHELLVNHFLGMGYGNE